MSLRTFAFAALLSMPFAVYAQAEDDAVLTRFDQKIEEGRDWLRSNREDPEWLRRDKETWKLQEGRSAYLRCKKDAESCQGS